MEDKYKKSKGNAGLEGVQFQLDLLTVSMLNALRNHKDWKISSENQEAGKYDDLVLEMPDKNVLLQAKFKQNKKITKDQLFSCNSKNADFSLPKYFLSYMEINPVFREKTVIICTNTDLEEKGLEQYLTCHRVRSDSILHYEGSKCSFFTLNKNIVADLKSSAKTYLKKNLQGKGVDRAAITDENIEDFLRNLQIFSNFPGGDELHKVIELLLSRLHDASLWCDTSYHEIYRKVEDWFKQPRGEYLTEPRARAMLCEIRSDKYCKTLKDYKLSIDRNDFDFTNTNRVFHVKSEEGHLLQTLKIFRALQADNHRKLYVNPDDTIVVQKHTVEAFALRRYTFLVLICAGIKDDTVRREISDKLREILDKDRYKKVIFVAEHNDKLIKQIGVADISQIEGSVTFAHLSKDTQRRLLKNRNIVFQGETISLQELLAVQASEYARLIHSGMLENLVKKEEVRVGVRPLNLDKDTARCYVCRTFEKESSEGIPEEDIFYESKKVILISDSAGMGKSTILTKLSVTIKDTVPHLWVIRINLNGYTRFLSESLKKKRKMISLPELLNSQDATKLANHFERFVFSMTDKVALMLDGVDEISPDYTDLVLDLLDQCQEAPNLAKVFVTTRPHMTRELETILGVRSFKMMPFTRLNQIDFLTSYWAYNLRLDGADRVKCKRYAQTLIDRMSSWIKSYGYWENHFAAVPLQVRMLAEIFQENTWRRESIDWKGCKEYLSEDVAEPKLPEKFDISKLYDMFIEKKRDVFVGKGNPSGNTAANQALVDKFEECLAYHRDLALRVVLREGERDLFCNCLPHDNDATEFPLKIGILQKLGEEYQFVHRTFAEYFVAECLLKELRVPNDNVEFQRLLIDEVMRKSNFAVVRVFLDRFLQKRVDSLPPDVLKTYKSFNRKPSPNPVFKLAAEGCVAILQLILKSVDFKIVTGREIDVSDWRVKLKFKQRNMLNDLQTLVRRAGVNIRDESGNIPLHYAVKGGHSEMTRFLVEQGADANIRNNLGCTALHFAASLGHLDIATYLVELGVDVNVRDSEGCTALHLAAQRSELDVIKYFVKHDADVKVRDKRGSTALHFATHWTWKGVTSLQTIDENFSSANYSPKRDERNTVKYLMKLGVDVDKEWGKLNVAKYLIERGVAINDRDGDGRTALHFAVLWSNLDIVKNLVDQGADLNVRDSDGRTPLQLAVEKGKLDTVTYLLESVGDINIADSEGRTALHFAADKNKVEIVEYLLQQGANVDASDGNGRTALHFAMEETSEREKFLVVRRLAEKGADINAKDRSGATVLHVAARYGNWGGVRYLVGRGADVNAKDDRGRTALQVAIEENWSNVVEFLAEGGVDVSDTDTTSLGYLKNAGASGNTMGGDKRWSKFSTFLFRK